MKSFLGVFSFFYLVSFVLTKPSEHRLSEAPHQHADGSHDASYDHEAFLGKEQSDEFNKLTKEESVRRLELIVDKIDTDRNGTVTYEELRDWIKKVHDYSVLRDSAEGFRQFGGKNGVLTWDAFVEHAHLKEEQVHPEDIEKHREQVARDKRKWAKVDENRDGVLSEQEFVIWQHPSEHPQMRDYYVEETLSRLDADKDGVLSPEEYMKVRKHPEDLKNPNIQAELLEEVEQLKKTYDKNHNNVFEPEEIAEWVAPVDYDLVSTETHHLIEAADDNSDRLLSKEEILNHFDLFVGSEATAQGKALEYHEEL